MDNLIRQTAAENKSINKPPDSIRRAGDNPARKRSFWQRRKPSKVALGVIIILTVAGACCFYRQQMSLAVNKNAYQAVFLTNGQVYFGKLHRSSPGYLRLTEIYYLQVQQPQPDGSPVAGADKNAQKPTDSKLIKLGQELHAPEDQMTISKDQILFWENLKSNGKVAQAITNYKAKSQ